MERENKSNMDKSKISLSQGAILKISRGKWTGDCPILQVLDFRQVVIKYEASYILLVSDGNYESTCNIIVKSDLCNLFYDKFIEKYCVIKVKNYQYDIIDDIQFCILSRIEGTL